MARWTIMMVARMLSLCFYLGSSMSWAAKPSKPLLSDFDALGTWFEGVAFINTTTSTTAKSQKKVSIAIIGAGITGLTTGLILDSVGLNNWELIEASDRVGGRFRTKYVGGSKEWAEMGPMRIPVSVTYKSDGATLEYTDHAMVFQLANWLNELNGAWDKKAETKIGFIPWIQHDPNELVGLGTGRHADGSIPTRADIEKDPSLGKPAPMDTDEYKSIKAKMKGILMNETTLRTMQRDVWKLHRQVMDQGLDETSQQEMMRHGFKASINVTDAILTASDYDVFWDEMHHNSNLQLDGAKGSLAETHWMCVDGGFNRLSDAFLPHVQDRLILNRQIQQVEPIMDDMDNTDNTKTIGTRLSWFRSKVDRTKDSKNYNYTFITAPFTMTRIMSLPRFSSVLSRAISERGLRFKDACKVALLFSERFWEKGDRPIFGGYSTPPSAAVGALYYPVYGLNETGRPGLIMHYRGGDWSSHFTALSDEDHVNMVLDAIVSLHGEGVRALYTGKYERLCWLEDDFTGTSWARPNVQQHRLYIPAYHQTEFNTIFIGEHTAPTHAWVSSSLYSAVRGVVQLLLELGLVDEAKSVNQRWMGRWITETS